MNEAEFSPVKIIDLLNSANKLRTDLINRAPVDGSQAARELKDRVEFTDSQSVSRVIVVVDFLSLVSENLLHGLAVLMEDGAALFSIFPLIRSVLEHSATIVWLLDPECTIVERAARAALLEERSQDELTKAAKRMSTLDSNEGYLMVRKRLTQLRAEIDREFGCSIATTKLISGQSLLRPTDIVNNFGDRWGEGRLWMGVYDFLCGTVTHPSLNISDFLTMDDERIKSGLPPQLSMSISLLKRLLRTALVPYVESIEVFSHYAGCYSPEIDNYRNQIDEVLDGMVPNIDSTPTP